MKGSAATRVNGRTHAEVTGEIPTMTYPWEMSVKQAVILLTSVSRFQVIRAPQMYGKHNFYSVSPRLESFPTLLLAQ